MPAKKSTNTKVEVEEQQAAKTVGRPKSASTKAAAPAVVEKKSASTKGNKKAAAAPVAEKKEKAPKKSASKKEDTPVAEEAAEPVEKVKRGPATRESVTADFEALETKMDEIIKALRESGQKNVGISNWKSCLKSLRVLHADANKIMKVKRQHKSTGENKGGFHKEVVISGDLSKFCATHAVEVAKAIKKLVDDKDSGYDVKKYTEWKAADWNTTDKATRSKVTKFMCDYVKAKSLQKADNKREFVVDAAMKALFGLKSNDKDNNGKPINYCSLQKLLIPHYPATVKPVKTA